MISMAAIRTAIKDNYAVEGRAPPNATIAYISLGLAYEMSDIRANFERRLKHLAEEFDSIVRHFQY